MARTPSTLSACWVIPMDQSRIAEPARAYSSTNASSWAIDNPAWASSSS